MPQSTSASLLHTRIASVRPNGSHQRVDPSGSNH
jgi:hypothetical protein